MVIGRKKLKIEMKILVDADACPVVGEPKSISWTQKVELLSPCTIARRCVS